MKKIGIPKDKILAYVLKNAIEHEGKAMIGPVISSLFQEGLKKEQIKNIIKDINKTINEVNSLNIEKQKDKFSKLADIIKHREIREDLPDLPKISKNMVFRLAPFPSGALHIGNAKTYLLNDLYAEKYKARILLIMDDTIGSKEKQIVPEAYKLITDAFDWLDIKYKKPIYYKSSRLEIYYKYALELLKKQKVYVCSCSQEILRENRKRGRECECRNKNMKEQIRRWKLMFDKKTKPGSFTVRIKTNMKHKNPAFRDRVLFRISDREHPCIGKKYKVWPLLEFSWAIDDHLLGITHIIRGKDLMIESEMEKYIWKLFGWPIPEIINMGLIRIEGIEGAKISKSKAQKEVREGKFIGWHDPRTWSIQSLKRRGFLPQAIKEFVRQTSLTQHDIVVPIDSLYAINRKMLDKQADRYFFIAEPVKLKIKNMPKISKIKAKLHPDKKAEREIKIDKDIYIAKQDYEKFKGQEIRLLNLFNIRLNKDKSTNAEFISKENKNIQKLQWVSQNIKTRILMPGGKWTVGLAEKNIQNLKQGQIVQFERFGFCRLDKKPKNKNSEYEFWYTHK